MCVCGSCSNRSKMGLIILTQLAMGLGVLAGVALVKSVMDQKTMVGPFPRCPSFDSSNRSFPTFRSLKTSKPTTATTATTSTSKIGDCLRSVGFFFFGEIWVWWCFFSFLFFSFMIEKCGCNRRSVANCLQPNPETQCEKERKEEKKIQAQKPSEKEWKKRKRKKRKEKKK